MINMNWNYLWENLSVTKSIIICMFKINYNDKYELKLFIGKSISYKIYNYLYTIWFMGRQNTKKMEWDIEEEEHMCILSKLKFLKRLLKEDFNEEIYHITQH